MKQKKEHKRHSDYSRVDSEQNMSILPLDEITHQETNAQIALPGDFGHLQSKALEKLIEDAREKLNKLSTTKKLKTNIVSKSFAYGLFDENGGFLSIPEANVHMFIPPQAIKADHQQEIFIYLERNPSCEGSSHVSSPYDETKYNKDHFMFHIKCWKNDLKVTKEVLSMEEEQRCHLLDKSVIHVHPDANKKGLEFDIEVVSPGWTQVTPCGRTVVPYDSLMSGSEDVVEVAEYGFKLNDNTDQRFKCHVIAYQLDHQEDQAKLDISCPDSPEVLREQKRDEQLLPHEAFNNICMHMDIENYQQLQGPNAKGWESLAKQLGVPTFVSEQLLSKIDPNEERRTGATHLGASSAAAAEAATTTRQIRGPTATILWWWELQNKQKGLQAIQTLQDTFHRLGRPDVCRILDSVIEGQQQHFEEHPGVETSGCVTQEHALQSSVQETSSGQAERREDTTVPADYVELEAVPGNDYETDVTSGLDSSGSSPYIPRVRRLSRGSPSYGSLQSFTSSNSRTSTKSLYSNTEASSDDNDVQAPVTPMRRRTTDNKAESESASDKSNKDLEQTLDTILSRLEETDVRLLMRVWSARTSKQGSHVTWGSADLMKDMIKSEYITTGVPDELKYPRTTQGAVGPKGGELEIPGFFKLIIPPEVLQQDTMVRISTVDVAAILRDPESVNWISGYPWSLGEDACPRELLDQVLFSPAVDVNLHGERLNGPVEVQTWRPPGSEGMKCLLLKHHDSEGWIDITASTKHRIDSDRLSISLQRFCIIDILWYPVGIMIKVSDIVKTFLAGLSSRTLNCPWFAAYMKPMADNVQFHVVCRDQSVETDDYLSGFIKCGSNEAMFDLYNGNLLDISVLAYGGQSKSQRVELYSKRCCSQTGQKVQMLLNRPNGQRVMGEVEIKKVQVPTDRLACHFIFQEEGDISPSMSTRWDRADTDTTEVETCFEEVVANVSAKWDDLARELGFSRNQNTADNTNRADLQEEGGVVNPDTDVEDSSLHQETVDGEVNTDCVAEMNVLSMEEEQRCRLLDKSLIHMHPDVNKKGLELDIEEVSPGWTQVTPRGRTVVPYDSLMTGSEDVVEVAEYDFKLNDNTDQRFKCQVIAYQLDHQEDQAKLDISCPDSPEVLREQKRDEQLLPPEVFNNICKYMDIENYQRIQGPNAKGWKSLAKQLGLPTTIIEHMLTKTESTEERRAGATPLGAEAAETTRQIRGPTATILGLWELQNKRQGLQAIQTLRDTFHRLGRPDVCRILDPVIEGQQQHFEEHPGVETSRYLIRYHTQLSPVQEASSGLAGTSEETTVPNGYVNSEAVQFPSNELYETDRTSGIGSSGSSTYSDRSRQSSSGSLSQRSTGSTQTQ
uniref:Netrin receptor UNC5 n=1 Tax=Branchiostoma floridae TaxID=7739 RepID=C3YSN3_BRAFL|eukprot:XP_002600722.1 hypothetical protein BRAFLDRAFT_83464 [Branchiostoma floridae]